MSNPFTACVKLVASSVTCLKFIYSQLPCLYQQRKTYAGKRTYAYLFHSLISIPIIFIILAFDTLLFHTLIKMCIAAFIWQAHPLYPLLLLQNRDEYHQRPTKPVGWWDGGEILGGRDELAGGTWLACSRTGRVAFLTNVLELHTLPEAKSRGDLPVLFLESTKSPMEFAQELVTEAHQYNGFNLILADMFSKTMVYVSNRPKGEPITIQEVCPGIHVLSNAKLDSPWHKAQRLGLNFKELLINYGDGELPVKEMAEKLMRDSIKADESRLPGICSLDWEYSLSSVFVEVDTPLGRYGTRSTAAVTIEASGQASFYEKYLEKDMWKEKTVKYYIPKLK